MKIIKYTQLTCNLDFLRIILKHPSIFFNIKQNRIMNDKYKMAPEELQSLNIPKTKLSQLQQLLPEVFSEDNHGYISIDVDRLKLLLNTDDETVNTDEDKTRYSFNWNGKQQAQSFANKTSNATLRPCIDKSINWQDTNNVYIEGDNLEVLKLLQKSYYAKIKMIYIDPPYNTGKDFVYKDNYKDSINDYLALTGQIDNAGKHIDTNSETNGRYHTNWLNMMYPRLKLARNLLRDDGVIFISIDDNEIHNLRKICDEIFGEDNFITQFIYEKTQHFGRQQLNYFSNIEYIVCYAKKLKDNNLQELLIEYNQSEFDNAPLYNASNNQSELEFPIGLVKFHLDDGDYHKTSDNKYTLLTSVKVLSSYNFTPLKIKFRSRWSQAKIDEQIAMGATFIIKSNNFAIRVLYGDNKRTNVPPKQLIFTNNKNPMCTYSKFNTKVGVNENATKHLKSLFKDITLNVFDYSKSISLISYLVSLCANSEDDIILDFFAGSSTTAHAVMELNTQDNGNRKYICVQLPEITKSNSEAYKAGYKNICDIGFDRIRHAGAQIIAKNNAVKKLDNNKLDIGCKYFKLDTSNIKDNSNNPLDLDLDILKPNRSNLDLFYELILKYGYSLDYQNNIIDVGGVQCYTLLVNKQVTVLAILDSNIDNDNFALAVLQYPLELLIIQDSCFICDTIKINTLNTIEQLQNANVLSHNNKFIIRII